MELSVYGMVQRGMAALVTSEHGEQVWLAILERAGVPGMEFVGTEPYPDEITYALVGAASDVLDMDAATLLHRFGHFWVVDFAPDEYGPMLDAAGLDIPTVLGNLNALHSRAGLIFPGYLPPRFAVTDLEDGRLRLHYYSHREGLAPFIVGLVEGVATRAGTPAQVVHEGTIDDHDVFTVTW